MEPQWIISGVLVPATLVTLGGNSMNFIYKMLAYHLARVDSKCCIWVGLKWNVCGAKVELKCHVKCWEL